MVGLKMDIGAKKLPMDAEVIARSARELIERYGTKAAEAALEHVRKTTGLAEMRERDFALVVLNEVERMLGQASLVSSNEKSHD